AGARPGRQRGRGRLPGAVLGQAPIPGQCGQRGDDLAPLLAVRRFDGGAHAAADAVGGARHSQTGRISTLPRRAYGWAAAISMAWSRFPHSIATTPPTRPVVSANGPSETSTA